MVPKPTEQKTQSTKSKKTVQPPSIVKELDDHRHLGFIALLGSNQFSRQWISGRVM
ncbi:hypothetical protein YC2023_066832 [Brassica napus]